MEPRLAARTLAASTDIALATLSSDDPAEILQSIVDSAAELVGADLGLLMLAEDDGTLTVAAVAGEVSPYSVNPVGIVLSARSSAARAARGGVPVVVDDFTTDPRTAPFVPKALRHYGPFAVAPFGTAGRRLGALAVYRKHGGIPFEPAGVEVLTMFAAQAAVARLLADGATARRHIAVYQERERLARDLHDVIVQRLYGTGMQLELLSRRLAGKLPEEDSARLASTVDELDATIAEVRSVVRTLRADPVDPDAPALAESVRDEVHSAGELLGVEPELVITGEAETVPVSIADHTRAALREALSNVVRHSGARSLAVALAIGESTLRMTVRDDGCGIPPGVTERGLRNIAERATAAGGTCTVHSSAASGTALTWSVPFPALPRENSNPS